MRLRRSEPDLEVFELFSQTGPPIYEPHFEAPISEMPFSGSSYRHFPCIIVHCYTHRKASLNSGKCERERKLATRSRSRICKSGAADGGHDRAGRARASLGDRGSGPRGDRSRAVRKPVCFMARTCDRRSVNCDRRDFISSSACFRSCT